jgi:hypothetical protein
LLALPLSLVIVAGCKTSATPAKVSGKVTYKNEPVPAGTVTFHTEKGGIFYYPLNPDGTYSGSDLPTGEMVVTIDTESANPEGRPKTTYGGAAGRGKEGATGEDYMKKMKQMGKVPEGPVSQGKYVKIPKKYSDKTTSPFKVTLNKGNNTHNFDLTD